MVPRRMLTKRESFACIVGRKDGKNGPSHREKKERE
jgi:hypothetical protein